MIVDTSVTQVESSAIALIGGVRHRIFDGSVLGRDGDVARAALKDIPTVSRKHAVFSRKSGGWFVMIPSSVANSTTLDGVELRRDVPQLLMGEHVLKLSSQAIVRIIV